MTIVSRVVKIDVRNVQKTGNMHYVYLPTSWCKKYRLTSGSKVTLDINNDGSLILIPEVREKKGKSIHININETNKDIIVKLIMACYINPTKSFNIRLGKEADITRLINEKKTVSALEFVELDGEHITYESTLSIGDPYTLLKTMVKKIKNLVLVMINHYNIELINRYEEEIDRSKLLIEKSVTGALSLNTPSKLKTIELHYIALISKDLERAIDHLILIRAKEKSFLKKILDTINTINTILEEPEKLDYLIAISLTKKALGIKVSQLKELSSYDKIRVKALLVNISEVFLDWAITKEVEKT